MGACASGLCAGGLPVSCLLSALVCLGPPVSRTRSLALATRRLEPLCSLSSSCLVVYKKVLAFADGEVIVDPHSATLAESRRSSGRPPRSGPLAHAAPRAGTSAR